MKQAVVWCFKDTSGGTRCYRKQNLLESRRMVIFYGELY